MTVDETVVAGLAASDLEAIFNKQIAHAREHGGGAVARTVSYLGVKCDQTLTRIPQNAREISFVVFADPMDAKAIHEDVVFSLILAQGSLNSVFLDVPFDCSVDPAEIFNTAEASGFGINLVPPENSDDLEAYLGVIKFYAETWLKAEQSSIRVAPIDGFIEYMLGAAAGYKPEAISTDPMVTAIYTEKMSEPDMDRVKAVIQGVVTDVLGETGIADLVQSTVKAIHLKDVQFLNARAKMIEEELDSRTPTPNLIRLVAQHTGLSVPNSAGLIYELLTGFMGTLFKYLPPDEPPADAESGVRLEDPGAACDGDSPAEPTPIDKLAVVICKAVGAIVGGEDVMRRMWNTVEEQTHVTRRIDLDRGAVTPGPAAIAAASAIDADAKVTALALAEIALLFGGILETAGVIPTIEQQVSEPVQPVKSAAQSNIIAVG